MNIYQYETYLEHHGIKGQKWGIRRYQNPDGSLTPEGRKRYNVKEYTKYGLEGRYLQLEKQAKKEKEKIENPKHEAEKLLAQKRYKNMRSQMKEISKEYKEMGYGDYVKTNGAKIRRGMGIAANILTGTLAVAGLTIASSGFLNKVIDGMNGVLGTQIPHLPDFTYDMKVSSLPHPEPLIGQDFMSVIGSGRDQSFMGPKINLPDDYGVIKPIEIVPIEMVPIKNKTI